MRMDVWVMARSWSKPTTWCYEIKVDRADWFRDSKLHLYEPLCNRLVIACPHGLLDKSEIPGDYGLLWVTKSGRTLMKKKPAHRDVEIPESLWRYVLMCRSTIGRDHGEHREDRVAYWRRWLEEKHEHQDIGHRVGRRLQQVHEEQVTKVEIKQRELESRIRDLETVARVADECGIDLLTWGVGQRAREVFTGSAKVVEHLEQARQAIKDGLGVCRGRVT